MRNSILSILLCFSFFCFAQQETTLTANQVKAFLEKEFAKVDKTKLTELVPFKKENKWGFIYANTKKVAIKPCFTVINLFKPDFIGYCNDWEVEIIANPFSIDVHERRVFCDNECTNNFNKAFVISSKTNFKGFSVGSEGNLESYSDIYYEDENKINISKPFEHNYEHYAIVSKNDSSGIIDVFGDPLEGFNFNYKKILLNTYALDKRNIWFYVEEFSGKRYFVSISGEKKFENEQVEIPLYSNICFGLSIVNNDTISGVFDLGKMEWMIKPQRKNKIEILNYSSKSAIDFSDPKNRDKAKLYFLVHNKKNEFYMDEKLNTYLPR